MKEDIEPLAREYRGKEDDPLYAAVMDLIIRANNEAGKEPSKEAEKMCDALKELIEDRVAELYKDQLQEKKEEGVKAVVEICRALNATKEWIAPQIMQKFDLSMSQATQYVDMYY